MRTILLVLLVLILANNCFAEHWLITAYCPCKICCGKTDGITASGKKAEEGRTCAVNWLKFGTKVNIEGLGERIVEDRGAKSKFGDKKHHIKHIDIFFNDHKTALKFGKQWLNVEIEE